MGINDGIYGQYMGINDVLNPMNPIYIYMDNTWVSMMY